MFGPVIERREGDRVVFEIEVPVEKQEEAKAYLKELYRKYEEEKGNVTVGGQAPCSVYQTLP